MRDPNAAPIRVVITTGEPAGIGPDITVQTLCDTQPPAGVNYVVLGDAMLLAQRAQQLGLAQAWQQVQTQYVQVMHHALQQPCEAGVLNPANGAYVLALLDAALQGCLAGQYAAMVTAPLQKSTINAAQAGTDQALFTGHTEYLAEQTRTPQVVMLLAGRQQLVGDLHNDMLRVALATTHLPLHAVASAIRETLGIEGLVKILQIMHADLRSKFGISEPRILVTGLNPHAGEGGYLGREEIDIIAPAIVQAQQLGMHVSGPYPADTLFQPRYLKDADCVLAMYHDQGLAPLKYGTFGCGINVTLGLPIIRTSVDHGTALELAGTGRAQADSMHAALDAAVEMARATQHQ